LKAREHLHKSWGKRAKLLRGLLFIEQGGFKMGWDE
jgi:hypothetical protein